MKILEGDFISYVGTVKGVKTYNTVEHTVNNIQRIDTIAISIDTKAGDRK